MARANPINIPESKIEVWVVDDNVDFQECITALIDNSPDLKCGNCFGSCEAALSAMEDGIPPDVLLLDIVLPGMNGLDAIKKFKNISPSLEIIIVTVYDDSDRIFHAICEGATGYLLKTAPGGKIIEAIHEVIMGGSPINSHIARKILKTLAISSPPPPNYGLTDREMEILQQMTKGLTKKEIGEMIFLSHHTIDTHIRSIYNKLQVNNKSGAIAKALKERLF
jgi:DNA-binding NarL/FixJ family response regulator